MLAGKTDAWVFDLRGAVYLHGLPEDDRTWSLEGAQGRVTERLMSLRRCSKCHAITPPVTRCPMCGAVHMTDPRPLRIQRSELYDQMTISPRERAEVYIAGAVRRMRAMKPALSEKWCRDTVIARAPKRIKEALNVS